MGGLLCLEALVAQAATSAVRQIRPDLPIVGCDDGDPARAALDPATVFLRQPVSLAQLRTAPEPAMASRT